MVYTENGSGIRAAVTARLNQMPDTETFTATDRRMVIESQLLIDLTRKDVQSLMVSIPQQITATRVEASASQEAHRKEVAASSEKLEVRVRILENFRWWLLGAVAFVSPIMAALTSWFFSKGHP